MTVIHLFDGTRDTRFGKALVPAFAEHAKYRQVLCTPEPGGVDIPGYKIVREAERQAFNPRRNQVNVINFVENVLNMFGERLIGAYTFLLSEQDFYHDGINWGFGCAIPDVQGGQHVALSTSRFNNLDTLTHVAMHELGHAFGAPSDGRRNTEENLGLHCTNSCVMEQRLSVPEMEAHARALARRYDKFCGDCQYDLKHNQR